MSGSPEGVRKCWQPSSRAARENGWLRPAGAAVVAGLGALFQLVEEIHLADRQAAAVLARLERPDAVVAQQAGDDVARAFEDLFVAQQHAVARLQDADALSDVLQQEPHRRRRGRAGFLPRACWFASHETSAG